jgi:hypothetical protein
MRVRPPVPARRSLWTINSALSRGPSDARFAKDAREQPEYLDHAEALSVVRLWDRAMSQEDFEDVRWKPSSS